MNPVRWLIGAACEMLTITDPNKESYDPYHKPEVLCDTSRGGTVVFAKNYADAAKLTDGTTAQGNVSRNIIHIGRNLWEIVNIPWEDK